MALNSTPRRRFGVALGVVLTTVSAGMIGFAGSAVAHTNKSKAVCEGDTTTLTVDLTAYRKHNEEANTVKITDGETVLHEGEFDVNYQEQFEVPGDVEHVFMIDVTAWDDPKGDKGWTFTQEHKVAACVEPTTPPEEPEEPTTPPVETTTEAPAPPSSEAPPVATTSPTTTTTEQEEVLAETGASVALPLGIGGFLVVGGAVAMFVVRRRSKA